MNGQYLRKYPVNKITDLFIPYIKEAGFSVDEINRAYLETVIGILQPKCELLSDIKPLIGIFLTDIPEPDEETDKVLSEEDSKKIIIEANNFLKTNKSGKDTFNHDLVEFVKEKTSLKGKKLFMPIRGILTGRQKGPELDAAVPVLGIEKCRKRIEYMFKRYITK